MQLEHIVTAYTKINSEQPNDLDVRRDTIKLLAENTGKAFSNTNRTDVFLGRSPKVTEIKTNK